MCNHVDKALCVCNDRETMEWIKCSDRMPELNKQVLLWDDGHFIVGSRYKNCFGHYIWSFPEDYDGEPSHWMTLPKSPPEGSSNCPCLNCKQGCKCNDCYSIHY